MRNGRAVQRLLLVAGVSFTVAACWSGRMRRVPGSDMVLPEGMSVQEQVVRAVARTCVPADSLAVTPSRGRCGMAASDSAVGSVREGTQKTP